jgi:hypothetical protein
MTWLVFRCWLTLAFVDATMRFRGFKAMRPVLQRREMRQASLAHKRSRETLCLAINLACAFYFREMSPLERCAATTLVMRRHGCPAELVIGAQILPYDTYAWVESEGDIVNDQPNLLEIYQVLDRC